MVEVSSPAPVALFVFNRPKHAELTIRSLAENYGAEQTDLYVFSDGPRHDEDRPRVMDVRALLRSIEGFKSVRVVERDENVGQARSIIEGVTQVVKDRGEVIVLEDDLVSSPYFLRYMNACLRLYENDLRVASIHAYVYPVDSLLPETFFLRGADCWGWATWSNRWSEFEPDGAKLLGQLQASKLTYEFDFDGSYPYTKMLRGQISGRNNSLAIRLYASAFLKNKFTLYPGEPLVENIGVDGSGTHCAPSEIFANALASSFSDLNPIAVEES